MKFLKGFIRAIFSIIITLVLTIGLTSFGLVSSSASTLTEENISNVIKSALANFNSLVTIDEETGEEVKSEVAQTISETLQETGLSEQQVDVLFTNEDLQKVVSDFASSVIMHELDGETEIKLPSEEETIELFEKNVNEISTLFGIEPDNMDSEQVEELIHENYDMVISQLEGFIEQYGGLLQ